MADAKILLVDDSETIRGETRRVLEEAGYRVIEAEDGFKGLDALRGHRDLNLIVCDFHMPEMTGIEMLKKAREDGLLGDTPIFMMTTEKAGNKMDDAKIIKVTAWILKPMNAKRFLAAVTSVLSLKSKQRGA